MALAGMMLGDLALLAGEALGGGLAGAPFGVASSKGACQDEAAPVGAVGGVRGAVGGVFGEPFGAMGGVLGEAFSTSGGVVGPPGCSGRLERVPP